MQETFEETLDRWREKEESLLKELFAENEIDEEVYEDFMGSIDVCYEHALAEKKLPWGFDATK